MTELYRLVYTSKNLMRGTESELAAAVSQILEASQRNNPRVGVTGALMFNAGAFAQVLEGPRRAVEATFERIQRDERHTDVTVLQCGPAEQAGFPGWSMAFVGQSAAGHALWHEIAVQSAFDAACMDGDKVFSMLHALVLEEEGLPAAPAAPAFSAAPAISEIRPAIGLDVERVRAELSDAPSRPRPAAVPEPLRPSAASSAPPPGTDGSDTAKSAVALAVFRAALADERKRTTELRHALDEMQVALAQGREHAERMTAERNLWASRAQLLSSALEHQARQVVGGGKGETSADSGTADVTRRMTRALVA